MARRGIRNVRPLTLAAQQIDFVDITPELVVISVAGGDVVAVEGENLKQTTLSLERYHQIVDRRNQEYTREEYLKRQIAALQTELRELEAK